MDFEESQIQFRFCVKPNVDAELDKSESLHLAHTHTYTCMYMHVHVERSLLHGLPDLMTKVAAEELHKMNYMVSECNVIYYPQVRTPRGWGRGYGGCEYS